MSSPTGLYGSSTGANMARSAAAEAVGTFLLVFIGTSVAVAASLQRETAGPAYDSLAVALAFGLGLVIVVAAVGHISGAHVNPAVTIALAVIRKFPAKYVPAYVAAQVIGAILGALATRLAFGSAGSSITHLGSPAVGDGVTLATAFFVEAAITFVLVFVIVAVATDERVDKGTAPLAVGFALASAVLIAGPLTGGSANPARAFGPMLVSGTFGSLWLFLAAPVVGAVLAALLYRFVLADATDPSEEVSADRSSDSESAKTKHHGQTSESPLTSDRMKNRRPQRRRPTA